ncbi:MAG: excinuclease ABC subunit UvrA [Candidatus Zixiibacteriota bacterium]
MSSGEIHIKGAREHNLKDLDVRLPREKLIVVTGLSGSGKSSLAFDTLFAEGQRRYVESLSAYARQFISLMEKPDVDFIEGLSPAIAIQQRVASHNPRSIVATATEIYDYLRLLFARIGVPHCPSCGKKIQMWHPEGITEQVLELPKGTKIMVLSPIIRGRKGEHHNLIDQIKRDGFVRVRIDGEITTLDKKIKLDKKKAHTIEIVVDRLKISDDIHSRLFESIETALRFGDGLVIISNFDTGDDAVYSEHYACAECGISLPELSPRMFSFNSPYGACPECDGIGTQMTIDPGLVIPDTKLSLADGAIKAWGTPLGKHYYFRLKVIGKEHGFSIYDPFESLSEEAQEIILYGSDDKKYHFNYESSDGRWKGEFDDAFEGVIPNLLRRHKETSSSGVRRWIEGFMRKIACPKCGGARLRKESLAVLIRDKSINDITKMSIGKSKELFDWLKDELTDREMIIAKQILKEIRERLGFLVNVGVSYLTLDRESHSLSGGEAQRIRLATQIGSQLVGVLYILDEPSIGLHQRDNIRLIKTLEHLRDLGNTIVVVEHDLETIMRADHIVDIGPRAGIHGGEIIAQGSPKEIIKVKNSLTGQYMSGKLKTIQSRNRKVDSTKKLILTGATGHNLKEVRLEVPLGLFVCVSGVSGSGKSSLINETLYPVLSRRFHRSHARALPYRDIQGYVHLDKVIDIDQSPIGRTPRSNPATYTGVFTPIRELFASLPESRAMGYKPGRFSFNVKGGRCEACGGQGQNKLEMHFLPDVYVPCDTCGGKRYNRETLAIKYKGKTIADVLEMTVDEALEFFSKIPQVADKLKVLSDVGLGYVKLGQSAITLSGGEAQRVKLSNELGKRDTGKTLYILDEPTVGLHAADVQLLIEVLDRLVERGNTVMVIEHNLEILKFSDWIIDLGPEGGEEGGRIIAQGPPKEISKDKNSYTGQYLKEIL